MNDLAQMDCVSLRGGAQALDEHSVKRYRQQVPDWEIVQTEGEQRLRRVFQFKNFVEALAFTNRVGQIAEAQDHHPALLTEWGRVTVFWWSYTVHGLHSNDFIMAVKTDQLYG